MLFIAYLLVLLLIVSHQLSAVGAANQTSKVSEPSFLEPQSNNSSNVSAPVFSNETNIGSRGTINIDAEDSSGNNVPSCDVDAAAECQTNSRSITFKWSTDGVNFICLPHFRSHEQVENIEFPCSSSVKFNSVSAGVNRLEIFETNSAGQRILEGRFTWIVKDVQELKELVLALESRSDRYILLKGGLENTTVTIKDKKSLLPVSGVNIRIDINYPSNNLEYGGRTGAEGIYFRPWIIMERGNITVDIYADKSGYDPLLQQYNFTAYLDKEDYLLSQLKNKGNNTGDIYVNKSGYDPLLPRYNFTVYLDKEDYLLSKFI